jgi:glycosyltransferase involved in cell wall biosynthesis
MKILHVISNLAFRSGGPSTVIRQLAEYQAKAGLDITVCTTRWGISYKEENFRQGLENRISLYFFDFLSPMLISVSMAQWFAQHINSFDCVHIHGLYRFPVIYAAWLARKKCIPYIIRPHGSLDPFLYRQSRYGNVGLPLKRMCERLFDFPNLNAASAIQYTACEEADRAAFLKLRAPAVIVPNGIDWEQYATLPTRGAFRQRIGLGKEVPLILFLGRINFKKGLDLLIPSFAQIIKKIPSAILVIVGPDNEGYGRRVRKWCQEQDIQDKVVFVDYLEPARVIEAYVDADVFVLPSYTENFGMTVAEAMACRCPVVISDQVNIWKEIKECGAGAVAALDPEKFSEAVIGVLRDSDAARIMGERGRMLVHEKFTWSTIVKKLTAVYASVMRCQAC